jgi:hypothetical protein
VSLGPAAPSSVPAPSANAPSSTTAAMPSNPLGQELHELAKKFHGELNGFIQKFKIFGTGIEKKTKLPDLFAIAEGLSNSIRLSSQVKIMASELGAILAKSEYSPRNLAGGWQSVVTATDALARRDQRLMGEKQVAAKQVEELTQQKSVEEQKARDLDARAKELAEQKAAKDLETAVLATKLESSEGTVKEQASRLAKVEEELNQSRAEILNLSQRVERGKQKVKHLKGANAKQMDSATASANNSFVLADLLKESTGANRGGGGQDAKDSKHAPAHDRNKLSKYISPVRLQAIDALVQHVNADSEQKTPDSKIAAQQLIFELLKDAANAFPKRTTAVLAEQSEALTKLDSQVRTEVERLDCTGEVHPTRRTREDKVLVFSQVYGEKTTRMYLPKSEEYYNYFNGEVTRLRGAANGRMNSSRTVSRRDRSFSNPEVPRFDTAAAAGAAAASAVRPVVR